MRSIPSILRHYHCLCDVGIYAFGFSCRLVLRYSLLYLRRQDKYIRYET